MASTRRGDAMDGFRIFFELRPLSDIQPWGNAESGLKLHWFGLTDGWYDVAIEGRRLYSGPGETRGIDYQVVRLWEDLLEVAPYALESVPEGLASRLADFDAWTTWVEKTWDLDDRDNVVSRALDWWFHREMSAGHLVSAPSLQMWRSGDELHLHWKSVPGESNTSAWSSPNGRATVKANAFREELIKFDRELIAAMDSRVSEIERNWNRPEIAIDVEELRREHGDRALTLQHTFERRRHREPTWDEVVEAVIALENRIGRP
jgi:hypothetical protein